MTVIPTRDFSEGKVDVLIGTHRVLSRDVIPKELGLVIVDEEQRFGVAQKELLRQLRLEVDVLAMSATPIPRTLEMGVAGIREMSTILTPPEERHPVLTYVGAYDEKQIVAAIRRELLREGQVFLVHNKVSSIERAASRIRELVPEARIEELITPFVHAVEQLDEIPGVGPSPSPPRERSGSGQRSRRLGATPGRPGPCPATRSR